MNCNTYFFIGTSLGYSQYPNNYTKEIISNILKNSDRKNNISQFTVSMNGRLAYVTYQYRYSNAKYFGICCEYNGVIPTNFTYLFEYFDNLILSILNKGELLHYDQSGNICASVDYISEKTELINYYVDYIRGSLNEKQAKFKILPPSNYVSSKKNITVLSYEDGPEQLINLLNAYDTVIVSRENPYVLGYANVLKKSSEKITELEKTLAKIVRQKKQYRIVVILILAVIGCLVALYSYNSNIKLLSNDIFKKEGKILSLNQDLIAANVQIDTLNISINEKDSIIHILNSTIKKNVYSIDSLNKVIVDKESLVIGLKENLRDTQKQLLTTNNKLQASQNEFRDANHRLLTYKGKIRKLIPIIVNDIEIANYTKDRKRIISNYGEPIYSEKTRWIWFRMNYDGMTSGYKQLHYRIYDQNGNLKKKYSSPENYTSSSNVYIYEDNNTALLFSWGTDSNGSWRRGKYRIEVWYNDMCLKAKYFTIY